MRTRTLSLAIAPLALLSTALPSVVAAGSSQPACLPADVVPTHGDSTRDWLSRSSASEIRAHLGKAASGGRWKGNELIVACIIEGTPQPEVGLEVEDAGGGVEKVPRTMPFSRLATASGHTSAEGEDLARRYASLGAAFYRYVRDEKGQELQEDALILRQHEKKLGITGPTEADLGLDGTSKKDQKARAAELREKIKAAKARGDMAEVMRLAGEAQAQSAPLAEKAVKVQERTDRQTWDLLQSAHADLARAAFRTRISFTSSGCLPCRPPEPPRR
jgi:hypothetical protein